jgi:hypothetical protein
VGFPNRRAGLFSAGHAERQPTVTLNLEPLED